jgi:hypothetical protein
MIDEPQLPSAHHPLIAPSEALVRIELSVSGVHSMPSSRRVPAPCCGGRLESRGGKKHER